MGAAELARAVGVARSTFDEIVEPYLRQRALVETTSTRQITERGRAYLLSIASTPELMEDSEQ